LAPFYLHDSNKSGLTNFQKISRIHFFKFQKTFTQQAIQYIKIHVKIIIVILFTRGSPIF